MTRPVDVILPVGALLSSFAAVLVLGQVFTTNDQPPDGDTPSPTPPIVSPDPTWPAGVNRLEITVLDGQAEQPAPGILEVKPKDPFGERRLCLTENIRAAWQPVGPDWQDVAGTPCRFWPAGPPTGLIITLVPR